MSTTDLSSSNTSADNDLTDTLQQRVTEAVEKKQPLNLRGGASKEFIGFASTATTLDVSGHTGIVSYEPTELVITARGGTTLESLNATLTQHGQMLPFEPPAFSPAATLGGTIACALSGPARPYRGATRDYVLGCRVINGHAHALRFGGEVMKNVAGYDVTRLMTGAMGTLGLLLDTSLKVLPLPEQELTLITESTAAQAIEDMQSMAGLSQPVTASAFIDGRKYIRLSGANNAITAAAKTIGGEISSSQQVWSDLREHKLEFFNSDLPLWRISVPPLTPELPLSGKCLYDWAGMQRWLFSTDDPTVIRSAVESNGGHATLYRASATLKNNAGVFQQPEASIMQLHKRIKDEFDPHGIFNPGRMYTEF